LCIREINELEKYNGRAKINSLLFAFKLRYSLIDVHAITLRKRAKKAFNYL
jgi:hypothetical protein